jgi:ribonuclease HI
MIYRIYSDGSTRGNGKENAVGGWAYVIVNEQDEIVYSKWGAEVGTTNQRMELTAAIQGLDFTLAALVAPGNRFQ